MNLKNKRVLITAGPTWVPIDSVRVISNIATAETGILLAQQLARKKAQVTLFLGPVGKFSIDKRIKIINFRFFGELRKGLKKELRAEKYDIIIHNAAVSDFGSQNKFKAKLASKKNYLLKLSPLPKIAKEIKILNPKAKLVIFKLEPSVSDQTLVQRAKKALRELKADLAVANRLNPYRAFIIDSKDNIRFRAKTKLELAKRLLKLLITSY